MVPNGPPGTPRPAPAPAPPGPASAARSRRRRPARVQPQGVRQVGAEHPAPEAMATVPGRAWPGCTTTGALSAGARRRPGSAPSPRRASPTLGRGRLGWSKKRRTTALNAPPPPASPCSPSRPGRPPAAPSSRAPPPGPASAPSSAPPRRSTRRRDRRGPAPPGAPPRAPVPSTPRCAGRAADRPASGRDAQDQAVRLGDQGVPPSGAPPRHPRRHRGAPGPPPSQSTPDGRWCEGACGRGAQTLPAGTRSPGGRSQVVLAVVVLIGAPAGTAGQEVEAREATRPGVPLRLPSSLAANPVSELRCSRFSGRTQRASHSRRTAPESRSRARCPDTSTTSAASEPSRSASAGHTLGSPRTKSRRWKRARRRSTARHLPPRAPATSSPGTIAAASSS